MPWVGKIIRVDEHVDLVISLETFRGINAREDEVFIEQHRDIIVVG